MSTTTPRRKKPATTAVIAISALMAGITAAESAFAQQVAPRSRRASAVQGPIVNRVVIEGNKACYGESACDCVLESVFPGAILGR